MKKMMIYAAGILFAVALAILSMTVLGNTRIAAPVLIVLSIYLFLGCLIKMCKMNAKLKGTVICGIDLLFWLP